MTQENPAESLPCNERVTRVTGVIEVLENSSAILPAPAADRSVEIVQATVTPVDAPVVREMKVTHNTDATDPPSAVVPPVDDDDLVIMMALRPSMLPWRYDYE